MNEEEYERKSQVPETDGRVPAEESIAEDEAEESIRTEVTQAEFLAEAAAGLETAVDPTLETNEASPLEAVMDTVVATTLESAMATCEEVLQDDQEHEFAAITEHDFANEMSAYTGEDNAEESIQLTEQELNEMIETLCSSKAEEFILLGYEQVTGKDIWDCVSDKYQKKGVPPLYQIVNDILSLKSTQFMNWMTISIYKGAQF